MPVPSSLADLSTTAASNSPAGTDAIGTSLDDYLRTTQALLKQSVARGTDIASASSITIPTNGNYCVVTGTTTINSIADSWNGRVVTLKFSGALTLTNSASLVLPGGENIVTAAGDCIQLVNESTGVWRCVSVSRSHGKDVVSVKDFGAVGDGIADDTAAIQAAINYAATFATATGLAVYFPRGSYLYSALTVSVSHVHLSGDGDAHLIKSGTTGDGLTIKSTGSRIYGNKVTGLAFSSASAGVSGRLVYCENVGQLTIKDIVVTDFPAAGYRGVEFYNVSQSILGAAIQNCVERGFYARDCADVTLIPGSRADNNGSHGWEFDTCSGVYATDATAYGNTGNGYRIVGNIVSPGLATAGNAFHFYKGCIADTSGSDNWFISSLIKSTLMACWGSTQKNTTVDLNGFVVTGCVGVDINGCIALTNNAIGLHIAGGSNNIQVRGGRFDNNGKQAGSARREGVVLGASTSSILDGVIMTDTQAVKTQQYGLRVQSVAVQLTISNCNMDGNVIYPYAFDAIPTNYNESNNYTAEPITVASAGSVFLPNFGRVFVITGTTNINALGNQWRGRQVTLIFQDVLTVGNTGVLVLAGNFTTTANDTLTLMSDGVNWYETSRSVN